MTPKPSHERRRDLGVDAVQDVVQGAADEALIENRLIEVKHGEGAVRDLRASLLHMSYQLAARPDALAYLVLDRPNITPDRLKHEWSLAAGVLHPEILSRLTLCVTDSARFDSLPREVDPGTQSAIADVVGKSAHRPQALRDRGSSWFVVTKVLMASWLRADGPITTDRLRRASGYSYPTVAGVLRDLELWLTRTSDRRVELRGLPRDLVERWLREAARVRRTARFADRSRVPRTPEGLAARLARLQVKGLALGGVLGAMHYYPDLDLTGAPRLDISQRSNAEHGLEFVRQLEPALSQTDDPREPAVLVVHIVTETDPMFEAGEEGLNWASPLECLLDLNEARLKVQAGQFLEALLTQRTIGG